MKKVYNYLFIMLLLSVGITSCIDSRYNLDEFSSDMQFPASLEGPIGTSKISLVDLLVRMNVDTTYIKEHPDEQLLYFKHTDQLRIPIEPLDFKFRNFKKVFQGASDENLLSLTESGVIRFEEELNFGEWDDPDHRIDSVLVKTGELRITILQSEIIGLSNDKLQITVFFPDEIHYMGGGKVPPVSISVGDNYVNLDNYIIAFKQNEPLRFTFEINHTGASTISLSANSLIEISAELSSEKMTYSKVWGLFKYQEVHNPIGIDLFKDFSKKNMEILFHNPKFEILAVSNISVPAVFFVDSIRAGNTAKGWKKMAEFINNGVKQTFHEIDFRHAHREGEVATAFEKTFNIGNVNIDELLGVFPDTLNFTYSFVVGGDNAGIDGSFVTEGAFIDIDLGVELPAWFKKGTFIHLRDTVFDVNIGNFTENDFDLNKAVVYFQLENGLPFDIDVELSFLDEDYAVIAGIEISNVTVASASVHPETNVVIQAKKASSDFGLTKSMLSDVKRIKHLQVHYKVNVNYDFSSVKVTSNNFLQVKMHFFLKGGIKL